MDNEELNSPFIEADETDEDDQPEDENMTDDSAEEEELPDEEDDGLEEKPKKKHHFHKPGKKFFIILLVIVLALGCGYWFLLRPKLTSTKSAAQDTSYVRSVTLSKGSLENTVTADGTIASQDTSSVTTTLKYTVKTIDVSVGDTVAAGDTIVTLDTTELEKQIERKETADEESLEKLQKSFEDAGYSKQSAYDTMANAKSDLADAQTTYDNASATWNSVYPKVSNYQAEADTAAAYLVTATTELNSVGVSNADNVYAGSLASSLISDSNYSQAVADDKSGDGCSVVVANSSSITYQNIYNCASSISSLADSNLSDMQKSIDYSSAEKAYTDAESALSKAQTTYDDAAQKFNTVNAQYFDAQDALNKGVTDDDLEDLKTDLANCTLKAETAGVVTEINATVGSAASGTVATIQNTNSLQITVSVDEYDIQSIEKGMTATITSDAITDELTGTVSTVSPVATTSNQGQSSSSFDVTVTIDGETNALLIGMSAEVKIILSSTGDVYTVPIDAVGTDDSGNSVIYVQGDDGTYSPVTVTTGDSNDYYIEVSGTDLKDGMKVRASADADAAAVSTAAASSASSDSSFSLGGMGGDSSGGSQGGGDMQGGGGGNAPSGGGPGGN
jgi:RND family efflux transporter MFP subunit